MRSPMLCLRFQVRFPKEVCSLTENLSELPTLERQDSSEPSMVILCLLLIRVKYDLVK